MYIFTRGSIHTFKNVLCLSFAKDMSMDIDFYFAMGIIFYCDTKASYHVIAQQDKLLLCQLAKSVVL